MTRGADHIHSKGLTLIACLVIVLSTRCLGQSAQISGLLVPQLPDAPSVSAAEFRFVRFSSVPAKGQPAAGASSDLRLLEGQHATISLLSGISSKMPRGNVFEARLEQPLEQGGRVILPLDTRVKGHIETEHARRMLRRGSVYLAFDSITLPTGEVLPLHAHIVSADPAKFKSDSEGRLQPRISHRRMAIELGGTALTGKLADDLTEALAGGAVGAATARYIGLGTSAVFLMTQKGPEAQLKPGDELEIEFGRADAAWK